MSITDPRSSAQQSNEEHCVPLIDQNGEQQSLENGKMKLDADSKSGGLLGTERLPPSSEDRAGIISGILFSYIGVYWWRTRNAKEDYELLEQPSKRITAQYASNRLERAWVRNGSFKRHFLIGVWHATKWNVLIHALSLILEECTRVAQPLLLRLFMSFYKVQEGEQFLFWPAMIVATVFALLSFVTLFIHHPYFHGLLKVGNDTRVGTGVLLYKKALRLALTSLTQTNSGQLIQLFNTDAAKLEPAFLFVHYVWLCPFLAIFYGFFLWYYFGSCCLYGFLFMMAIVSIQVHYSYQLGVNRRKLGDKMDARLRVMSEVITGIKVIKMHNWEKAFADKINVLRENEIKSVGRSAFCSSMVMGVYFVTAKIGLFIYIMACLFFNEDLTTKGVFAASALYNSVRLPFALFLPLGLLFGRELISTSRRINFFFRLKEYCRGTKSEIDLDEKNGNEKILEKSDKKPTWLLDDSKTDTPSIYLNEVTSVWYDTLEDEEQKQLKELKVLNGDDEPEKELEERTSLHVVYAVQYFSSTFSNGRCYGVIGPVGSGKSSLLMTILSESRMTKGNLEVQGSIAYCAQEPWIFTGTVRENILFGNDYDSDRYQQALDLCLLHTDLFQMTNGDQTVVGDNGATLSGGQRARIALARAIYSDADIYLLDDPLSAVDTQVGRKLYENLIRGHLSNKLVILVTHQIHFLNDVNNVILMKNNSILGTGSLSDLKSKFSEEFTNLKTPTEERERRDSEFLDHLLPETFTLEDDVDEKYEEEEDQPEEKKKLAPMTETRKTGIISFSVYWQYTKEVFRPFTYGTALAICVLITQLLNNFVDWWLNKWLVAMDSSRSENGTIITPKNDTISFFGFGVGITLEDYQQTFIISTIVVTILGVLRSVWFRRAQLSASRALHNSMFKCIINAQSEFFDVNSEGTILNRFAKDISLTDDILAFTYFEFIFGALTFMGIVSLVMVVRPIVSIASVPILLGFYVCRNIYVARSRELKRIESKARSPLNTLITSTLYGLATIRAFRKEKEMIEKFCACHDVYMAAYNMASLSARWFAICIDFLVSVFVSIVVFVVVFQYETLTVGEVGLCLVCAVQLSGFFSWIMRQSAELENGMVSVERVLEYTKLKSEEDVRRPHDKYLDEELEKSWPTNGVLEFEHVSVKYNDTPVLKDITFVVLGGQKIGVVGRTGAGKSTLIRVLFGLKEYDSGRVLIDGIDLDQISLQFRRSGMSIIPQEPVLFSGTVRENLDPFNQYDDATIWSALEQCELKRSITKEKGLHVELGPQGVSLSVGQRQLFCLARAMIHHSKILVIDEATANVDGMTDACIQNTIRTFFKNATIITVAHRLHTIMNSDRIMVFEKGALVEFDKPITLLNDPTSVFSRMAAQTGTANFESLKSAAGLYALEDSKLPDEEN